MARKSVLDHAKTGARLAITQTANAGKNVTKHTVRAVKKSWSFLEKAGATFWIVIFFIFITVAFFFFDLRSYISGVVVTYGLLAILVLSFVLDMIAQPVGPDVPLITGIVLGLPPFEVIGIVLIGSSLALLCTYWIGRSVGEPGMRRLLGQKKFEKIQEKKSYVEWALFIGAISPVPYIPYLAGVYRFTFKQTLLFVLLPRLFRFTVVGVATMFLGARVYALFQGGV